MYQCFTVCQFDLLKQMVIYPSFYFVSVNLWYLVKKYYVIHIIFKLRCYIELDWRYMICSSDLKIYFYFVSLLHMLSFSLTSKWYNIHAWNMVVECFKQNISKQPSSVKRTNFTIKYSVSLCTTLLCNIFLVFFKDYFVFFFFLSLFILSIHLAYLKYFVPSWFPL